VILFPFTQGVIAWPGSGPVVAECMHKAFLLFRRIKLRPSPFGGHFKLQYIFELQTSILKIHHNSKWITSAFSKTNRTIMLMLMFSGRSLPHSLVPISRLSTLQYGFIP